MDIFKHESTQITTSQKNFRIRSNNKNPFDVLYKT